MDYNVYHEEKLMRRQVKALESIASDLHYIRGMIEKEEKEDEKDSCPVTVYNPIIFNKDKLSTFLVDVEDDFDNYAEIKLSSVKQYLNEIPMLMDYECGWKDLYTLISSIKPYENDFGENLLELDCSTCEKLKD